MSTMYPVIEIEYKNRKPSKAVVMRTLGEYLKQGGKCFSITWGENWIDLDYHPNQELWYGSGWIKDIGGDDIAQELNSIRKQAIAEIKQFKKDHFQFIHVGG
jgi:hypothetical protein